MGPETPALHSAKLDNEAIVCLFLNNHFSLCIDLNDIVGSRNNVNKVLQYMYIKTSNYFQIHGLGGGAF